MLKEGRFLSFDDILEESLLLLKSQPFIAENIGSLIRSIHVDEYQDTVETQYQILSAIVSQNKNINILFVGDPNQAIFSTLGGRAKSVAELNEMFNLKFTEMFLDGCYRSNQRIIDYYSNFSNYRINIESLSNFASAPGVIKYDKTIAFSELPYKIADIVKHELETGVPKNEICVAAPQWDSLFKLSTALHQILPNVEFDAPYVSAFKPDPLNPFYLLAWLTFTKSGHRTRLRLAKSTECLNMFRSDYNVPIPENFDVLKLLEVVNGITLDAEEMDGIKCFMEVVSKVFQLFKVAKAEFPSVHRSYEDFLEKTNNRVSRYKIDRKYADMVKNFTTKSGIVLSTIHGLKGEEYRTVIAFDILRGKLPHWNIIFDNGDIIAHEEANKMLYVLCSRAKEKIFLFSECGVTTKGGNVLIPTPELADYLFDYDY